MKNQSLIETIRRELPEIMRTDPDLRDYILDLTRREYAGRAATEDRFFEILAELRRDREEGARKWDEDRAEEKRKWDEQAHKWEEQNLKWEEQNRKWYESKEEENRKWEEQNLKWEEQNRKWDESKEEENRKWEEQNRKWYESKEEQNRKWEEQNLKWDESREEQNRKWEEQNRRWDDNKEEQKRKWDESREEQNLKWEEQNAKWREQNRKWYENLAEQREEFRQVHEEIMAQARRHDRSIGALGARWGLQSEKAFRDALAGILEKNFGVQVLNVNEYDDQGTVFGRPDQIELDIIIQNGLLLICELKSSIDKAGMYIFERKAWFYEQKHQRTANRLIVISPMIDPRARQVAERLGIETYGDSLDVETL